MTSDSRRSESDWLDDLRRMNEQIKALPEPLAYIVLDHAMRDAVRVTGRDGHGRKYLRVQSSVLDELKHVRADPMQSVALRPPSLSGIPVHRREDLPEGWPYA